MHHSMHLLSRLESPDFPSIVLPAGGRYLDDFTPINIELTKHALPFPKFLLEFSVPEHERHCGDGFLLAAWIVGVEALYDGSGFSMWCIHKVAIEDPDYVWIPFPADLRVKDGAQVIFDEEGIVVNGPLELRAFGGGELSAADVYVARYYAWLRLLAHLHMILGHPSVVCESVTTHPAAKRASSMGIPIDYYKLRCNGPTPFNWLRGSGMITLN